MRAARAVIGTASGLVIAAAIAFGGYAATAVGLGKQPVTTTVTGVGKPITTGSAAPPSALLGALATPSPPALTDASQPSAAAVSSALLPLLADANLGPHVLAQVTDAATGQVLFDQGSGTGAAPASTAKIATAAAVFATHASTDRITTTVVAGASAGQVVLVGAGDPTLSGAAAGTATPYAGAARISDLATQLKGTTITQVIVDGRLFTGPATATGWLKNDTPTDYASPITAAMADGGRDSPAATIRSANPDLAAGIELAADLGLPASKVTRGNAPANAKQLASVQSATYGQLVDEMLLDSDNVIAECLGRAVAIKAGQPASFTGAAAAIRATLQADGVDIGPAMTDASGLAGSDRLSPATLDGVLKLGTQRTDIRPVIDDLPVAGWDGTLAGRYQAGTPQATGAGLVRAKTGTLTSVSTLAGVVTTAKGRVLIFAFMADQVGPTDADTEAAETALDLAAAALVNV
jgi:D-alanyl-D-alanine carboxypeptidase/D-alanyl-D-alanine-endopeptidase (penicillin-binding protein 4)